MNLVAKLVAFFNNFFATCAKYSRPAWEFRIRYSIDKQAWVIELHEDGSQTWATLTRRCEATENELHVYKFESYQAAYQFALTQGLSMAYEQAHFTANKRALHPAAATLENAILEATLGGMGATGEPRRTKSAPYPTVDQGRHSSSVR